jgi:hypothetical protein
VLGLPAERARTALALALRIQVDWRKKNDGSAEPRSFIIGQRRLWVARVLEAKRGVDGRRFVVATTDRRRFLLCEDLSCAAWKLAAVLRRAEVRKGRLLAAYGAAVALPAIALWRLLRK